MRLPSKKWGKENRITLRAFCELADADLGNIIRMERRAMPPPQDREILCLYAKALNPIRVREILSSAW